MEEDPGICAKLDSLSSRYSDLSFDSEHTAERSALENKAREAVTVSLGHLREIHKRLRRRDCSCSHHIGQPTRLSTEPSVVHPAQEHQPTQLGVLSSVGGDGLRNHDPVAMATTNATAQSPSAPLMALATAAQQQALVPQKTGSLLPPDLTASATSGLASQPCDPARPNHADEANRTAPGLFQAFPEEPHFPMGNSPGHEFMHAARNMLDGQSGGFMSPTSELNQRPATEMSGDHNEIPGYPFFDQNLSDAFSIQSSYLNLFDIDDDGNIVPP